MTIIGYIDMKKIDEYRKDNMGVRSFGVGDTVLCTESGVSGKVLNFYIPTSCEEQTSVLTDDGRKYHAPTRTWVRFDEGEPKSNSVPIMYNHNPNKSIGTVDITNKNIVTLHIDVEPELVDGLKSVMD